MYGLIGKSLAHSFSANYFNEKFQKENIEESYKLFPIDSVNEALNLIGSHPDLKGFNVTIPYKQEIIPLLDEVSPEAEEIGAVNVVKISRIGDRVLTKGFNTDIIGFRESLIPHLHKKIKSALILGTGGASKAIAFVLKQLDIPFTFVSRNSGDNKIAYEELSPDLITNNLLIVNTTPVGMFPDVNRFPPIPYESLTSDHICFDLIYNPEMTEFMKKSRLKGATVVNGLGMLYGQAEAAWNIWNS